MAGVKRRTKYRKQVEADILDEFHKPEEGQLIVQIVKSHGSNILEVCAEIGSPRSVTDANRYFAGARAEWRNRKMHFADKISQANLGEARYVFCA